MAQLFTDNDVGICNLALSRIKHRSGLVSLDEKNSKAARVCKLHYGVTRDALQRSYDFGFNREWVANVGAAAGGPPKGGKFTTALAWPADALRILKIDGLTKRQWTVLQNRRILASVTPPVSVLCLMRRDDVSSWDPLFKQMMVLRLAKAIGPELTRAQDVLADIEPELQMLTQGARTVDSYETDSEEDDSDYDKYVPEYIAVRV